MSRVFLCSGCNASRMGRCIRDKRARGKWAIPNLEIYDLLSGSPLLQEARPSCKGQLHHKALWAKMGIGVAHTEGQGQ